LASGLGPERGLGYDFRRGWRKKKYLRFLMGDLLAFKEFIEGTTLFMLTSALGTRLAAVDALSLSVSPICFSFLFSLSHVQ
jgi:hypothetical protein